MRQIKFRAWDESMGRMVFCPTLEYRKDGTVFSNNFDSYGNLVERPLMQFTGLHDSSGVEVYEGDIVSDHVGIGSVVYSENNAGFRLSYGDGRAKWFYDYNLRGERESIAVIGNIHENPELLEPKE